LVLGAHGVELAFYAMDSTVPAHGLSFVQFACIIGLFLLLERWQEAIVCTDDLG